MLGIYNSQLKIYQKTSPQFGLNEFNLYPCQEKLELLHNSEEKSENADHSPKFLD